MKISINLLPEQLKASKKSENKKTLIIRSSIGLLSITIIITIILFGFVISESFKIKQETKRLEELRDNVSQLRDRESLVSILKNRVDTIKKISGQISPQEQNLLLINKLVPEGILLSSLAITKPETILISAESPGTSLLQTLFENLTDPKINDGRIQRAKVDSFNKGQSTQYRLDLTISIK